MKKVTLLCSLPLAALASGCVATKSSTPLSPTVAGPIAGVNISAPLIVQPKDNVGISSDQQPVTLTVQNAASNGSRPLTYTFEVASDADFTNKVLVRDAVAPGEGTTAVKLPDPLATGRTYYWHARAQDGANTGSFSALAIFSVFTPVVIGTPAPLAPINNSLVSNAHPQFSIGNASRSGPVGPISYVVEIADSDAFANRYAAWTVAEQASQTNLNSPADLPLGKQLFWHVRAVDPNTAGPWSSTQNFRTPAPVVVAPTPTPGTGGNCSAQTTQLGIVQCERSKYPTPLGATNSVTMLKAIAVDLNRGTFSGGPFGILRKSSGSSCNGYSCDIICSGQGSSQAQWDVLSDSDGAANPQWFGPNTQGIRVDVCEIQ